ncbi:hypothetical protein GGF46_003220 [Coemansia sp. RSA 552]|nr:hypothetical protein GGF46_003220 [Coemansia sp. RSA 552]
MYALGLLRANILLRPAGRCYSSRIPNSSKLSWMLLPTQKLAKDSGSASSKQTSTDILTKAGYILQSTAGIYTLMPMGQRVIGKIEAIVDEEMQRVGGQKMAMPTLLAPENWIKTGRWESAGGETFTLEDRKGAKMVLGPTHEEEVTAIVRDTVHSYRRYPLRLYQTTRKFRDEVRPRAGLLRGREFIMKDMYSFDTTKENAIATFGVLEGAYRRFFDRIGVPYAVAYADSGDIGGSLSKEFHFVSGAGEDTLLKCKACGHMANEEHARSAVAPDVIQGLGVDVYGISLMKGDQVLRQGRAAVPRGHALSLLKIKQAWTMAPGERLVASSPEAFGMGEESWPMPEPAPHDHPCFVDACVWDHFLDAKGKDNAHRGDWHVAQDGDTCGECHQGKLESQRGIEVGHIFYLGDKYSRALDLTVSYQDKQDFVQMGCYGIGISRVLQAAAECSNSDGHGLRWPLAIAPYLATVVPLHHSDRIAEVYSILTGATVNGASIFRGNVVVDDRDNLRPGFRLYDAQLLGIPVTVVMGRRFAASSEVEVQLRVPQLELPDELAGASITSNAHEHKAYVHIDRLAEFLALALQAPAQQMQPMAD